MRFVIFLSLLLFHGLGLAGDINLDHRGDYVVGYMFRNGVSGTMPVGWSGNFDEKTGVSYKAAGIYQGKSAVLLHCPWRNGTGIAYQEMSLELRKASSIRLRGSTAMAANSAGKSDGSVFRVFVNGINVIDRAQSSINWQDFDIDLSKFSGDTVKIRFETDPGPDNKADFDFSLWGDRRIDFGEGERVVQYSVGESISSDLDYSRLGPRGSDDVVPLVVSRNVGKFSGGRDVDAYSYRTHDDLFSVEIERVYPHDSPFPSLRLLRALNGQSLLIPKPVVLGWMRTVVFKSASLQELGGNLLMVARYKDLNNEEVVISTTLKVINRSVVLHVTSNKPWINKVETSGWMPEAERIQIPTPYYSGQISFLPRLNLFANNFIDWKTSSASGLTSRAASYKALTDGIPNLVNERFVYSFSDYLEEVFPNIPNPISPFREEVAGRIVLDAWGGSFADIKNRIEGLKQWGLDRCVLIVHDWQRDGYDNGLPNHYPASKKRGGEVEFSNMVSAAKDADCLVAAHQNYVDTYTNSDEFIFSDVALDSSGEPIKAWFNSQTGMQSYATRPNAMVRNAESQAGEIFSRYGTNASFLDVNSSMPPWFHVDMRANEAGAGKFSQVFKQNAILWSKMRHFYQGPVFGEGADHWYWSGLLDGVPAQPGAGWEIGAGDSAALAVGFNLLKIHPLQINHGVGYYHRWSSKNTGSQRPSDALLDRYRMQEVAFAHASYLDRTTWYSGWDFWLERNLVTPVVKSASKAQVVSIQYFFDGVWINMSQAALAESWSVVRITYDNGLVVVVNGSDSNIDIESEIIPPSGWVAKGGGVNAWSKTDFYGRNDYSRDASSVFANVRNRPQIANVGFRSSFEPSKIMLNFPGFSTDSSFHMRRTETGWILRVIPGTDAVSIFFDKSDFDEPAQLDCDRPVIERTSVGSSSSPFWGMSLPPGTLCSWLTN